MTREMIDSGIEWIGDVPHGWIICTAFQLFTQVNNKNTDQKERNLLSLSYGKIKRKDIETTEGLLPESFDGYNIIEPNDIVLRLTDLQNDQKSLRVGLSHERGIVTSAYLTIRNRGENDANYLFYFLHSFDIAKGFYGMGGGVRQGLNWDGLKWVKITVPPISEQRRIADFLDSKCAEIDRVVAETEKSIEEYKKLKQSVITEAVSKGIRGDRPMKDSGIAWIGAIPQQWRVLRGKTIMKLLQKPTRNDDGVITCFRDGQVTLRSNRREEGFTISLQEIGYQGIDVGDLVVHGMDGFAGAIGISDSRGKGTPVLNVLDSTQDKRYLMFYLRCAALSGVFLAMSTGIRVRSCDTNWNKIKNVLYIIPAREEQNEIVDYLDGKCAEIDRIIETKQQLFAELNAYKKSLIYEYVTGKTEVPVCQ